MNNEVATSNNGVGTGIMASYRTGKFVTEFFQQAFLREGMLL